jgi:hypothetical protein
MEICGIAKAKNGKIVGLVELEQGEAVKILNDKIMEFSIEFEKQPDNLELLVELGKMSNTLENLFSKNNA